MKRNKQALTFSSSCSSSFFVLRDAYSCLNLKPIKSIILFALTLDINMGTRQKLKEKHILFHSAGVVFYLICCFNDSIRI